MPIDEDWKFPLAELRDEKEKNPGKMIKVGDVIPAECLDKEQLDVAPERIDEEAFDAVEALDEPNTKAAGSGSKKATRLHSCQRTT